MTTISNRILEKPAKHQGISVKICEKLRDEWPRYKRLPPIKKLAQELQTSRLKTHRAVQDLVNEGILVSKPKLGTIVNETENDEVLTKIENLIENTPLSTTATFAKPKWTQIIQDSYVNNTATAFHLKAIKGFTDTLKTANLRITHEKVDMRSCLTGDVNRVYFDKDILTKDYDKSDALLLVNPNRFLNLTCQPNQILSVISCYPNCQIKLNERFDFISFDQIHAAQLAGEHIKQMGWDWDDVCCIGSTAAFGESKVYSDFSETRINNFEKGLGRPIRPEFKLYMQTSDQISGAKAVPKWLNLSPRPSVIFTTCDDFALGFINGAYAHGLEPGKDYQIIGIDGQQNEILSDNKVLTTVEVPMEEMGKIAAKLLLERFKCPEAPFQRIFVGCSLRKGNTVIPRSEA